VNRILPLRFLLTTVLLAATPLTAAVQQDTVRLTLDEALELARVNSPSFLAARNDEAAADWEVREAYGSLLPFASVGGGVSWQGPGEQRFGSVTLAQDQPAYYFSDYNVGLTYQLDGSRLLEPAAARARRDVTTAQILAAEVNLKAAVTRAYLELLRRGEDETLTRQQLERARFNLRLARGQQEVGTVTPLDVRQAEVQVGRAEVSLLQANNTINTARLRLLQQIGLEGDRPVALTTSFRLEEPAWSGDTLLVLAMGHNPDLAAGTAAVKVSDTQVEQARSAYLPSLSARAGLTAFTRQATNAESLITQAQASASGQVGECVNLNEIYSRLANPLPTLDCSAIRFTAAQRNAIISRNASFPFGFTRQPLSVSLSLSLPLFQGLARERQVEAAKVQREDANLQVRAQRIAITTDLTIALRTVSTAFQSAVLEARNRSVADDQLRLAGERYRVGAISFVDLVDAETVKAEADQAYVNSVHAYHDAVTELEAVVGTDIR
jgi:outer membrane protein